MKRIAEVIMSIFMTLVLAACSSGQIEKNENKAEEDQSPAKLVGAKHDIPYHVIAAKDGVYFDRARAEQFDSPNRLAVGEGEEIELVRAK